MQLIFVSIPRINFYFIYSYFIYLSNLHHQLFNWNKVGLYFNIDWHFKCKTLIACLPKCLVKIDFYFLINLWYKTSITNTQLKYYVPNFITFFINKIWRSNFYDRVIFIYLIHFVNIFTIMSWVNNAAHFLITLHPPSFEILMLFPFQCCHTFDFKS